MTEVSTPAGAKKAAAKKTTAKKTVTAKAGRKRWERPTLTTLPDGTFELPQALLDGPNKGQQSVHAKALVEALQILVVAHNQRVDEAKQAETSNANLKERNSELYTLLETEQRKTEALDQTFVALEEAFGLFGYKLDTHWDYANGVNATRLVTTASVTAFLEVSHTIDTHPDHKFRSMTVGSSKRSPNKLKPQPVEVNDQGLTLAGANTLTNALTFALHSNSVRNRLPARLASQVYSSSSPSPDTDPFDGLLSAVSDELGLLGTMFPTQAKAYGLRTSFDPQRALWRIQEARSALRLGDITPQTLPRRKTPFSATLIDESHRLDPNG